MPSELIRSTIALALILLLIFTIARLIKYFSGRSMRQGKRLVLIEMLNLDNKRRLAIIKCDNVEYLTLLGNQSDCMIAIAPPAMTNIVSVNNKNKSGITYG